MEKSKSTYKSFYKRHIGPTPIETQEMLKFLGYSSTEELITKAVPTNIYNDKLDLPEALSESQLLKRASTLASENKIFRSFIGEGYYDCETPTVIQRNILENPGWYTAYTPYQAEISQGRMEALLNFQTMVTELTQLELANASLLDEGTAAAEAMTMCFTIQATKAKSTKFFVDENVFPQTLEILKTRALPVGIEIIEGDFKTFDFKTNPVFAAFVQYPNSLGEVCDYGQLAKDVHENKGLVIAACDILSLCLLKPPGAWGADIAVGSTQRFGVPMGFGGPHAAYLATHEAFKRNIPGRIIGVSKDTLGKPALRLALQTREQHIRREKATSNICTSQVLLAVMASMYAVYHGPEGLKEIARHVHKLTNLCKQGLQKLGLKVLTTAYFDTLTIELSDKAQRAMVQQKALAKKINLNFYNPKFVKISFDECKSENDVLDILGLFNGSKIESLDLASADNLNSSLLRNDDPIKHPIFKKHHSETQILRYINGLEKKDISLTRSMIALGSCTMKLNATTEMVPVTWPEFGKLHPFAPQDQTCGYAEIIKELKLQLQEITGYKGVSLQPNAGSQGEYAGLLVIKKYLEAQGQGHRNICLIPSSAHGTNPASAVMAGMKVIVTKCDDNGNIDISDLKSKAIEHSKNLAALMITYPSTHGVFETTIREICQIIHDNGGQVYMDGANLNALVGVSKPGEFGSDVSHLNLHKTFCIPHGGGGPGVGPIAVGAHLVPYLPSHSVVDPHFEGKPGDPTRVSAVSAAPWGSASILPISWAYCSMMGADGLRIATETAILNANYIAKKLEPHFPILYKGENGLIAHECIIDLRPFKTTAGVEVNDVAKRLMDYGFHSPTMSWPVAGTLMIEPTESESKSELDRFCQAMIQIKKEIEQIAEGKQPKDINLLTMAPHTADDLILGEWNRPYTQQEAFYPLDWVKENKYWVPVNRIDNAFGDRNLVCACLPLSDYE